MDLSGPRAISSINAPLRPETGLRLFQRVTAQILDIAGTTAVLSIEGIPIVAQLSSTEQAATLLTQQTAQFVVTQLTHQKVTLKLLGDDPAETGMENLSSSGTKLAVRLLEQYHIPITDDNLTIARAVLKQHLPITASLLHALISSLENYGTWGNDEADLAAALKASGLPVTAESIELASRQTAKVNDSFPQLIKLIQDMAKESLPAELLEQLTSNLQWLSDSILDGTEETSKLVAQLKTILETLGRSQENLLLGRSQSQESTPPENGLLTLARLEQIVKQMGRNETAETISKFLEDIRSSQFLNAKSEWLQFNFPLRKMKAGQEFSSARLHVSREKKFKSGKFDPPSTRLILQVDITARETVEVDLSVMGKQIRTSVTATDPAWCQQAENELPSLEQALQNLGFHLNEAQVSIGEPQAISGLKLPSDREPMMAVDIEI